MMNGHLLIILLISFCNLGVQIGLISGQSNDKEGGGVSCYDCNYSPSGDVRRQHGWVSSEEAGYRKCALASRQDALRVDKIGCNSGTCFIRMDQNGLLYRGCADTNFLPWSVNIHVQCKYQGPFYSLWWFCNSTLCNDGLLDGDERCAFHDATAQLQQQQQQRQQQQRQGNRKTTDEKSAATPPRNGKESAVDQSSQQEGYGRQQTTELRNVKPVLKKSYSVAQEENPLQPSDNPCDGICRDNSSGLYAHPNVSSYFIHCGHGNMDGRRCYCCQPFIIMCPAGTVFDDTYKICRRAVY